jgi:hypothetical protein
MDYPAREEFRRLYEEYRELRRELRPGMDRHQRWTVNRKIRAIEPMLRVGP